MATAGSKNEVESLAHGTFIEDAQKQRENCQKLYDSIAEEKGKSLSPEP